MLFAGEGHDFCFERSIAIYGILIAIIYYIYMIIYKLYIYINSISCST